MCKNLYSISGGWNPRFLAFFICCFLSSFLCISSVYAQLSGIYTIGGVGGDYATFSEAVSALQSQGVSGPVTFNVRPGTYEEQVIIPAFSGNSCENPVVFDGASGSSSVVLLQAPEEPEPTFTVQVNGADGIAFRNMHITGEGRVIETMPGTDCFSMENNTIKSFNGRLVVARSGTDGSSDHHVYRNNHFLDGITGIEKENEAEFNPTAPNFDDGLIVEGNRFIDQRQIGLRISGQQDFMIRDNQFSQVGSGISVTNSWYGKEISGNTIKVDIADYQGSGITLSSGAAAKITENNIELKEGGVGMVITTGKTRENEILFANNMVVVDGYDARGHNYFPISNLVGVDITSNYGNKIKVYHNSLRVIGYSEYVPNYTFSASGESNSFHVLNNSIANNAYGTVLVVNDASVIAAMDYNNLNDLSADYFARLGGEEIPSLAEWQSKTGFDEHSINVNPTYPQDPNEAMIGAGTYLSEVPTDIYGEARNNPPTIGAVEGSVAGSELSGTYTIGGTDGDYAGFADAVAALDRFGVRDSVIFEVRPGVYEEQLSLTKFYGNDKRVTFEGESGDRTEVVIQYPLQEALVIRGARNLTFRNLSFSSGIRMESSNNLLFENNIINGGVYALSVGGDTYRNNLFRGQGIEKTSRGMDSAGGVLITDGPVRVEGNTFEITGPAVSFAEQHDVTITGNSIETEKEGEYSEGSAIRLSNNEDVKEISRNTIRIKGEGTTGISLGGAYSAHAPEEMTGNRIMLPDGGTGIRFDYSSSTYGPVALVANNMISVKGSGNSHGVSMYSTGAGIKFLYNSIHIYGEEADSSSVVSFDIDMDEPVNVHFTNNIFANTAGGYVLYGKFYDQKRIASSDYNNLYTNGEMFAHWEGTPVQDLSQWQTVTGFDEHSISVDPQFQSPENLLPTNSKLNNAGTAVPEVDRDINGKVRDDSPIIGAVELGDPEEEGPVVNAGRDKTLVLPNNSISLSGTGRLTEGRFVAFRWEKVSGPAVSMSGQNTANVKLSDLEEGEYVFRFSATDNKGRTASDEVTITVEPAEQVNQVPVVSAGRDKTIQLPTDPVLLRGIAHDADGRFVAFRWEKISGPDVSMSGQNTANVRLTDLQEGEYVFRFSATDNEGATGSDEVTLIVEPGNQLPVISAGRDVTITTSHTQYYLSGTGYDPDGRFTAFRWEKVSGPEVSMGRQNTANLRIFDFEAGEYIFRFFATDNEGATVSDDVKVTVIGEEKEEEEERVIARNTDVTAYPNTFRNFVTVEIKEGLPEEYEIMVFDMMGKRYYRNHMVPDGFNSGIHTIELSDQAMKEGAYFIRVQNKAGSFTKTLKIVKAY